MLGARQDRMLQAHPSPCWKGAEGRRWTGREWDIGPIPLPLRHHLQYPSSKAVSQLGAPWFWRQLGCGSPWKWDQSLWLWGSVSTWLEQRAQEQLNSRRGFIKRHAANSATVWQPGWKEECLFKKALRITTTSCEVRSCHLLIFPCWSHTLKNQNKYKTTKKYHLLFLKRWYGFSKSIYAFWLWASEY